MAIEDKSFMMKKRKQILVIKIIETEDSMKVSFSTLVALNGASKQMTARKGI